jgi:SAM-dependent methyltransferase
MESFPEWADKFYGMYSAPYLPTSEAAKAGVERGLPQILKHLPRKGSRVLDLCCGAGAYLFPLERAGYKVTGLDIQRRMISSARRFAKEAGSKAKLVQGDPTAPVFPDEDFDAIVFLGAPFGHFSIDEFGKIAAQAYRILKHKGVMLAEVNDHVGLFLSGMYQRILYEPSGDKDAVSIHTRYDAEAGTFNRLFLDLQTNKRFKGSFYIWTPFILHHLMREAGFALEASEQGSFGFFSRLAVYRKP